MVGVLAGTLAVFRQVWVNGEGDIRRARSRRCNSRWVAKWGVIALLGLLLGLLLELLLELRRPRGVRTRLRGLAGSKQQEVQ